MPADPASHASLLRADAFLSPLEIEAAVTRALVEDLGRAGDITSIATIPEDLEGRAVVVGARGASGCFCGGSQGFAERSASRNLSSSQTWDVTPIAIAAVCVSGRVFLFSGSQHRL